MSINQFNNYKMNVHQSVYALAKNIFTYKKTLVPLFVSLFCLNITYGQCLAGEVEVSIVITTDVYANEGYWELVPVTNACGVGTIASGGNTDVGCDGADLELNPEGGYANDQVVTVGPWCLTEGEDYTIHYIDDYADGGFEFEVLVNGYEIEHFTGESGLNEVFTFSASEPMAYDLSLESTNMVNYMVPGDFDLSVMVSNQGAAEITSYTLSYSVDNGPTQTHAVTGSSLQHTEMEEIEHSIPLNFTTYGNQSVMVWISNLNGTNTDGNTGNDFLNTTFQVGPATPNLIDLYNGAEVTIESIAGASDGVNLPTDLDFHPTLTNRELWVINKDTENSGGSTVTIFDAGLSEQTSVYKSDGNAWHFMSLPTGIAFSENGNWASSPGILDANHSPNIATHFTGPTLWSSDMTVYAEPPLGGGNGSHLDMLHLSPQCQGICAEKDNVFWVFDGFSGDLVRYDFAEDHGAGANYHGDGIVRRYSDDTVAKDPDENVVSHLILDADKKWLYVVDHGNQRVIRIDITTGSDQGGTPQFAMNEPISEYSVYTGYTQETVVATGLVKPAGIDVIGNRMIVSEHESGQIIVYNISTMPAVELYRIETGKTTVQGVKIGPDGRIWFVDQSTHGVFKIESAALGVSEFSLEMAVYPNPSKGTINVVIDNAAKGVIEVRTVLGQLIKTTAITGPTTQVELEVQAGIYFVQITLEGSKSETKRVVIQ